jgi:hypothetical protein
MPTIGSERRRTGAPTLSASTRGVSLAPERGSAMSATQGEVDAIAVRLVVTPDHLRLDVVMVTTSTEPLAAPIHTSPAVEAAHPVARPTTALHAPARARARQCHVAGVATHPPSRLHLPGAAGLHRLVASVAIHPHRRPLLRLAAGAGQILVIAAMIGMMAGTGKSYCSRGLGVHADHVQGPQSSALSPRQRLPATEADQA